MPREYRHIKQYEKEIMQLREEGFTYREIGEQLGIEQSKINNFSKDKEKRKENSSGSRDKTERQTAEGWKYRPPIY